MRTLLTAALGAFVLSTAHADCPPHPDAVLWRTEDGGNGHYYARINEPMEWQEARVRAEKLGGHLATLTSQAENDFVMPLCQPGEGLSSWLGGQRAGDGWNWVTGEKWAFTNWSPGEPNNTYGAEYYLISWIDGVTWNDGGAYSGTFIVEWNGPLDCNEDDVCDLTQLAKDPGLDLNQDGVIDSCQCIADVVADGEVNGVDLARILNDWGQSDSSGDINGDGVVGGADLSIVLSSWGPCTP